MTDPDQDDEYMHLLKAHILGVFLDDFKFKDAILDAILAKSKTITNKGFNRYPGLSSINLVYENTSRGSPLRQMMLDIVVEEGMPHWMGTPEHPYHFDSEFMTDLVVGFMTKRESLATDDEEDEEEDRNMSDEEDVDENEDEEECPQGDRECKNATRFAHPVFSARKVVVQRTSWSLLTY